jgi:hypothetical protein
MKLLKWRVNYYIFVTMFSTNVKHYVCIIISLCIMLKTNSNFSF